VLPDKRDQLPEVVENVSQTIAAAQGVLWFKVGSDPATGEIVVVSLWSNQAEIDAFLTTDARKASIEQTSPLVQGEPSAKNYQVSEAKK
jgi:quinol monooxygenase YgiN